MPTIRGFVEALEIGRAGQASAFLIHADGSRGTYTIADLDADPERFNERLSELGLLRDAMDRAEPVEIEHTENVIQRLRRLTRDALEQPRETGRVSGQVVGLALGIVQGAEQPETTDTATLALLVDGNVQSFVVALQTPERGTAEAMVAMAQAAQVAGSELTVDYDTKSRTVVSMELGGGDGGDAQGEGAEFDGFVEAIGHKSGADLMAVLMTTAPAFQGEGNVVPLAPFTPAKWNLLVLRGSPEYPLFEAGLRDGLRMRVQATARDAKPEPEPTPEPAPQPPPPPPVNVLKAAAPDVKEVVVDPKRDPTVEMHRGLVRGAQLLAPLCSAARPVWIQVNRQALDVGPVGDCVEGLPSSDLTPRTLRAIDLPYRAEWLGTGCFNHGVYRFQFELEVAFVVLVDGEELCVHEDPQSGVRFAHACLDGEHLVQVILEGWTCRARFGMDVYRIR